MSELAQTTADTIDSLKQMKKPIMDAEALDSLAATIKPLNDLLQPLKINEGSSEATQSNVKAAVRSFLEPNEKLDKMMNKIYLTASNLLTLSTQYLVTKSLLTNPQMFAEKVHATEVSDATFKKSKDIKGMKNFMIDACILKSAKARKPAVKSLLQAFDDSDDDVESKECNDSSSSESTSSSSHSSISSGESSTKKSVSDERVATPPEKEAAHLQSKQSTKEVPPTKKNASVKPAEKMKSKKRVNETIQPEQLEVQPPKKKKGNAKQITLCVPDSETLPKNKKKKIKK